MRYVKEIVVGLVLATVVLVPFYCLKKENKKMREEIALIKGGNNAILEKIYNLNLDDEDIMKQVDSISSLVKKNESSINAVKKRLRVVENELNDLYIYD